ncbi:MAG: FKBP-type peptidyl-prolyl cis-trans isomerase [Bacteroidota bacterium]
MKIKRLIVLSLAMVVILGSCSKSAVKSVKMKSDTDSLAYALGTIYYNGLMADSIDLNPLLIAKAFLDCKEGKAVMTEESAQSYIMVFVNAREHAKEEKQAEANKELYKDYAAENEAFLARNKERAEVTTTSSGLQYEVIKMGNGPKPTTENVVKVHYTGTLIDGTEFDSSVTRGEPAVFPLSGVIAGWTEALQLMPVGSKFRIYLPQSIGYGDQQAGEQIKPYSTLIFDVELLEIVE